MIYDIYYHNDFDGRASAAIILNFLRTRGDDIGRYVPVAFDLKPTWSKLKFSRPTIIVDFIYHPRAAWWYDHHLTSFIKPEWQKSFRPSKLKRWNSKYPSCCSLVLDSLEKDFKFEPPIYLRELARWLDITDAAGYKTARQAIEFKEPAMQIMNYIDEHSKNNESLAWLIDLLSRFSLRAVMRDPRLVREGKKLIRNHAKAFTFYKKHIVPQGRVGVIDLGKNKLVDLRFSTYYLYPRLVYNLIVKDSADGFRFSVGTNPWRRSKDKTVNIGRLLKRYGGGGHRMVGGLLIQSKTQKEKIIQEIITILNS